MSWIAVRVEIAALAAEAVENFLFEAGATGIISECSDDPVPPRAGWVRLEAHVPEAEHERLEHELRRYLASLAEIEPAAAGACIDSCPVAAVDWQAVFRRHHRPTFAGRRVLVVPPWDVPAASERIVLVIEPGMAFGTGDHATTRTCLEAIEDVLAAHHVEAALDVGTGSGILAAALARFGVPRVVALDVDPLVLPLARANLVRNAAEAVLLLAGQANALRARFGLVVANLAADALVGDADALADAVAPAGHLVVSGLLATQADGVRAAYPAFRLAGVRAEGPWRTLTLVRAP